HWPYHLKMAERNRVVEPDQRFLGGIMWAPGEQRLLLVVCATYLRVRCISAGCRTGPALRLAIRHGDGVLDVVERSAVLGEEVERRRHVVCGTVRSQFDGRPQFEEGRYWPQPVPVAEADSGREIRTERAILLHLKSDRWLDHCPIATMQGGVGSPDEA